MLEQRFSLLENQVSTPWALLVRCWCAVMRCHALCARCTAGSKQAPPFRPIWLGFTLIVSLVRSDRTGQDETDHLFGSPGSGRIGQKRSKRPGKRPERPVRGP